MLKYISNILFPEETFKISGSLYHIKNRIFISHCVITIGKKLDFNAGNDQFAFEFNKNLHFEVQLRRTSKNPVFLFCHRFLFEIDNTYDREYIEKFRTTLCQKIFKSVNGRVPTPYDDTDQFCINQQPEESQNFTPRSNTTTLYSFVDDHYKKHDDIFYTIKESDMYNYTLSLYSQTTKKLVLCEKITKNMYIRFNKKHLSVAWIYHLGSEIWDWLISFPSEDDFEKFRKEYTAALYETLKEKPFSSLNADDSRWLCQEENIDSSDSSSDSGDDSFEENNIDGVDQMTTGTICDRTFIANGSEIDIYKHEPISYVASTQTLKYRSDEFVPKQMLLYNSENNMLLKTPNYKDKAFNMDIERGRIVDTWNTNFELEKMVPISKFSQQTVDPLLYGLHKNGIMTYDQREKKKMVNSLFYSRSTNTNMVDMVTTGNGDIVIGTETGDVKLFNRESIQTTHRDSPEKAPRAKTVFPGMGMPVIGLDVSLDGEYILATYRSYVAVFRTFSKGKSGFSVPLGTDKPKPIIFDIEPKDVRKMGMLNLRPAKFDVGNRYETKIVSSSGNWLIEWTFKNKHGQITKKYHLTKFSNEIVNQEFVFDSPEIVVATVDCLSLIK